MHPSSHLFTPASPPDSHLLSFASTSRLSTSISRHVLCLSLSTSTSTSTSRHVLYLPPLPLTPFYTTRLVFCLPSSASRLLPLVFCLPPPFYPPHSSSPPPVFRLRPAHHCRGCGLQARSSSPNPLCSSATSARRSARISVLSLNRQGPDRTCVRFGPVMP